MHWTQQDSGIYSTCINLPPPLKGKSKDQQGASLSPLLLLTSIYTQGRCMPIRLAWSSLLPIARTILKRHTAYDPRSRFQPYITRQFTASQPLRMSDSESDGFRIADDSGSDDFVAPSKVVKKSAPAKKAATASSSKAPKVGTSTHIVRRSELTV